MMRFFEGYGDETSPARGERRGGGMLPGGRCQTSSRTIIVLSCIPILIFIFDKAAKHQ